MAAYVPTVWVNYQAPPLSAANLDKLTDELEAQALEVGLAHSLPDWTDNAAPALTDATPWNEMERVLATVAADVGLSYAATVWEDGWTPTRNAARLNRMEQQAALNRAELDEPSTPSAWVPTPPSSYATAGTFTKQVVVDSGLNTGFVTWTASRQHIVKTTGGVLFITYSLNGDGNHNNETWRLKRSNDGGSTWSLVTDSTTAGYAINGGGAPGLEIDADDNVYVVVSQYRATSPNIIFRVFKYTAANNYASPTSIFSTALKASNKWGCYWDQSRDWLWIMAWERGFGDNSNDLLAIDAGGTVQVAKKILGPFNHNVGTTRHADASYPVLTGAKDGTIIFAWHNEAGSGYIPTFPSGTQSYYDVEFVYSEDGGTSFIGQNGAIVGTVIGDDSAPSNRAAYRVVDRSPWATAPYPEFISATDPAYLANGGTRWNLNMLEGLAFNNNAVHFYYMAFSSPAGIINPSHRSHAKFDWASKTVTDRTQPLQATTGTSLVLSANQGNFVQDTTQTSRLYFLGTSSGSPAVIYSDDGGGSWRRYAVGSSMTSPVYTGACRWVQSDGKIIGCTQSGASVVFLEVTPT